MSFGRPAYIADSLILWFSYFFQKKKNFVPDKLPKLYKIFVQKQSITCIKKNKRYVCTCDLLLFSMLKISDQYYGGAKTLFFLFPVELLADMEVAHVTLRISSFSFFHWNYFFLHKGKSLTFGKYATFLCIALMANCMSCKYI